MKNIITVQHRIYVLVKNLIETIKIKLPRNRNCINSSLNLNFHKKGKIATLPVENIEATGSVASSTAQWNSLSQNVFISRSYALPQLRSIDEKRGSGWFTSSSGFSWGPDMWTKKPRKVVLQNFEKSRSLLIVSLIYNLKMYKQ